MQAEQWQALYRLVFVCKRGVRFFLYHAAGLICSHLQRAEGISLVSSVSALKYRGLHGMPKKSRSLSTFTLLPPIPLTSSSFGQGTESTGGP